MTGVYFCGPSLCQQCTHCTWLKCYWGMCTLAFTVTFPQCIMSTMHTLHMALVLLGNVHIGLHCNYWRTYTFWTRRGALVPSYRDGNFSSCTLPPRGSHPLLLGNRLCYPSPHPRKQNPLFGRPSSHVLPLAKSNAHILISHKSAPTSLEG